MKRELEPLIGPAEFAAIMGVAKATVFSWLSRKVELPPFVRIGGTTRWRREAVQRWIHEKERQRRRSNFEE